MKKEIKNFPFLILIILFFLNLFAWKILFDFQRSYLKVIFFDVGEGDAIFIETTQGHQILIDGGPDLKILEKLAKEMPFYDRTIDLIILTHPERDHLIGLNEVLKRYKIENILWTGVVRKTADYQEWKKLIEKEKAKIFISQPNQKIIASKAIFTILFPLGNLNGLEMRDSTNDSSIVTKLVFGKNSFLFTGDISQKTEERLNTLISDGLKSDVLKIAHHGSKYSNSESFFENVSPELAIIQSGKNPYGHPSKEVLESLSELAIKILRTDEDSDIKIISNGKNLSIDKKF